MNDMQIVRDFCAEEAPPAEPELAALRARVVAGFEAAPARPRRARPPRRPRLALAAAAVAALAGAVTAAVVIPSAPGGRTASRTDNGAQLAAAIVLRRAAQAALAAPLPGKHPFIYAETVTDTDLSLDPSLPNPSGAWIQALERKEWISVTGQRPGTQYAAPCRRIGESKHLPSCLGAIPAAAPLGSANAAFTYTELQHAPTGPQALLGFLEREQVAPCRSQMAPADLPTRDEREWSGIATVLADVPVLPPRFGAALFDAAAQIPGISVITNITMGGQPAVAVAATSSDSKPGVRRPRLTFRMEFVFNASTYRYIGSAWTLQLRGHAPHGYTTELVATRYTGAAPTPPGGGVSWSLERCAGVGLPPSLRPLFAG